MNLAMWNGRAWVNNSLSEGDLQDHPDSNLTGNPGLYEGLIDGEVRSIIPVGTDMYVGGNIARAFPGGATFQYSPISHITRYEHFKVGYSYYYNLRQGVDGYVNAMATDGKNLYAGGQFIKAGGLTANYVARWHGRAWFTLGVEIGNIITGLAVKEQKVYAAWSSTPIGSSEPAGYIVQWDNPGWSGVAAPVPGQIYSVHRTGNDLIVGGAFVNAGEQVAVNVARLDLLDGAWHPLTRGSGVAGGDVSYVRAIAEHAGALYLGGQFTVADTIPARNIAVWEPSSDRWSALGAGLEGEVSAIAVAPNCDVYAGGECLVSGQDSIRRIARWDGQRWNPMLGGVVATARAIAINGDNVYVAGDFDTVDGRRSSILTLGPLVEPDQIPRPGRLGHVMSRDRRDRHGPGVGVAAARLVVPLHEHGPMPVGRPCLGPPAVKPQCRVGGPVFLGHHAGEHGQFPFVEGQPVAVVGYHRSSFRPFLVSRVYGREPAPAAASTRPGRPRAGAREREPDNSPPDPPITIGGSWEPWTRPRRGGRGRVHGPRDPERWLMDTSWKHVGSFIWICERLGYEPDHVRSSVIMNAREILK